MSTAMVVDLLQQTGFASARVSKECLEAGLKIFPKLETKYGMEWSRKSLVSMLAMGY